MKNKLFIIVFISFVVLFAPLPHIQLSHAVDSSLTKEELGQFIVLFITLGLISEDKIPALQALLEFWGLSNNTNTTVSTEEARSVFFERGATWGNYLITDEYSIPEEGFRMFYVDTTNPSLAITTRTVETIDLTNMTSDPMYEFIPTENFGAYWVGKLTFEEDETREITISQKNSLTRVTINGTVVFPPSEVALPINEAQTGESSEDKLLRYHFAAGTHTIEVEYINSSEEPNLAVRILPENEKLNQEELSAALSDALLNNKEIWLASVFKSSASNHTVQLTIDSGHTAPNILILTSVDMVEWHLEGDFSRTETILIASKDVGSHVADLPLNATALYLHESEYDSHFSRLFVNCVTQADGYYYCDNTGGLQRAQRVVEMFIGNDDVLTGLSVHYTASSLSLPEYEITAEARDWIQ